MTKIVAAPTHHQGYDFVAVLVQDRVLRDPGLRSEWLAESRGLFGMDPVLVGEQNHGTYGEPRAVNMLRNLSVDQLPWQEYRLQ